MPNLDRFQPPTEPKVVAECAHCQREIYVGDEVMRIDDDGAFVHTGDCAEIYAMERTYDRVGVIGDNGEIE